MHSDPQISLHAIAPPFKPSRGTKIQRLCRVNVLGSSASIDLPSTGLCTDQFIRLHVLDKISASFETSSRSRSTKRDFHCKKAP